jgi:hypothetical protein
MQVRLDGKAVKGTRDAGRNQVRLLATLDGPDAATSVVAAQARSAWKPMRYRWPRRYSARSTSATRS